jgi:hypothetical protein
MKKTFLTLLIVSVAVWSYAVSQFLAGYFGRTASWSLSQTSDTETHPLPTTARSRPLLDTSFRDPFLTYLYTQKPIPKPVIKAVAKPAPRALVVIEPLRAKLSGILWGDSPVAILKQDGRTELAKEGAEVFGLMVKRIERHQVTVLRQGRQFILEY